MKTTLYLIRKTKANFLRFRLHGIVGPFTGFFLTLSYLSKLSKWRRTVPQPEFNDFYSSKVDYSRRTDLYSHVIKSEQLDGPVNYLEFGVAGGRSFKWWLDNNKHPDSRFVGFDTFTGLPEDWFVFKAGDMTNQGELPAISDTRGSFEKGLFQDTLPAFLDKFAFDKRLVLHMDADLYTSTYYVLTSIAPKLKKGDIILFDEFGVPMHEFKAFTEFVQSYRVDYKVIGAVNNYLQVAIKIV
jgi:O-methyltransferase